MNLCHRGCMKIKGLSNTVIYQFLRKKRIRQEQREPHDNDYHIIIITITIIITIIINYKGLQLTLHIEHIHKHKHVESYYSYRKNKTFFIKKIIIIILGFDLHG